jgi:squalene-hopene/tetraprenyl-beta-curcumene cyclase
MDGRSWFAALLLALPPGCAGEERDLSLEQRIDRALEQGVHALVERQSLDGAWRSEVYGALGDGLALTPSVLKACLYVPIDGADDAAARGLDWLVERVGEDGSIDAGEHGLGYPVYTAALATIALTQAGGEREPGEMKRARDAWLTLLRSHQLDEGLGWQPDDAAYGGWGYSLWPARKGESGLDADLSSTLFALGALRMSGTSADDPSIVKALSFVKRCQNLPLDDSALDPALDPALEDGGFFFTPTNALQNKAGTLGIDGTGRTRYRSYGSLTADGVRALLRCGLPPDHPRVVAARRWLERNFDSMRNPGDYDAVREVERRSSYYYASWSQAHAFFALGLRELDTPRGRVDWASELAEAILARQREDGTWSNPAGAVMEDDPLIATPFALAVLGLCRTARAAYPGRVEATSCRWAVGAELAGTQEERNPGQKKGVNDPAG